MADFQYNSFPINATPLADVGEITSADGILVVKDGVVQQAPPSSLLNAIGAFPASGITDYVPKTTKVNGHALSGDVTVEASDTPFTPTTDIEADKVQDAITEAVGLIKVERETELYANQTTTTTPGDISLNDDVSDYQYLDIYTSFSGYNEIRRIPVDEGQSYSLRFLNLSDTDTSTFIAWSEISLSFSDTVMTVNHNKYVNWSGKVNSDAVVATSGKPYIIKVMGIKYDFLAGSGGGGSSNYNDLSNKPSINSVTLSGNKSGADLGLIDAPSSPTTGQFLSWSGSAWVAASLPVYNGGVS